ncbi:MAG: PaaI family thioesterase [Proteobacteria bacterium]|nr:PaaI family thioesterase [Pseudomonadota bacterium]
MPKAFNLNGDGFNPFCEMIGLCFTMAEGGRSRCELEITSQLFNPHRVLHGGVIYTMADTGMGAALYSEIEEEELCSTVEIKTAYFGAVFGGRLVCDTRVVHKGRKIAFLESEVRNDGRLIAQATGTYYIFKMKQG